MKELYTSPEVKLIAFQAEENLANEVSVESSITIGDPNDITLDLSLFD